MMSPNDFMLALTEFNTSLMGELSIVAYDRSLLDNTAVGMVFNDAKLQTVFPVPVDNFRLHEDDGDWHFTRNGGVLAKVFRGVQSGGSLLNTREAAEYDRSVEIWPSTPQTIATEIANGEILDLAYLLNGAYSGIPTNEFGVAIKAGDDPNVPRRLSAYLQIYAALEDKRPFVVLSGDTANYFPINPMYPTNTDIGAPWFDGYQSVPVTPANVRQALQTLQLRRNFKGQLLGYGQNPATVELWHPPELAQTVKEVLGELVLLPGTGPYGVAPVQVPITGGGGTNQVVFGSQTNTIIGKAKPRQLIGMRPDLWCIVETGGQKTKEHALFWAARGGNGNDYRPNMDPGAAKNPNVPYINIMQHNPVPESPVFMGLLPGTKKGDIGFSVEVNKGMALCSPHRIVFNYTGLAS
jgi:hypothetical protein